MHRRIRLTALSIVTTVVLAGMVAAAPALAAVSNDPASNQQWALAKIKAPAAWTKTTGQGVRVGIVDTGVDLSHEDLAGQIAETTNCIGSNGDQNQCKGTAQDDEGHGTHVSGLIAAAKDNGRGIAGVAPGAKLVVAKALDSSGSGNTSDIDAGIKWVVDHGARVVNLSLGQDVFVSQVFGTDFADGVEYAWQHGAVAVLAAGNQQALGFGSAQYGSIDAVVVGATGPKDEIAAYSSPTGNAKWAVVAPGGNGHDSLNQPTCDYPSDNPCIISTYWTSSNAKNGYAYEQGTSMAAPHVTATLALLMSQGLSAEQAVQRLLATVDRSVSCGTNSANCHGRIDAGAAVGATAAGGTAPPPTAPAPTGAAVAHNPTAATGKPSPSGAALAPANVPTAPAAGAPAGAPPSTAAVPAGSASAAQALVPPVAPATVTPKPAGTSAALLWGSVAAAALAIVAGFGAWWYRRRPIGPPGAPGTSGVAGSLTAPVAPPPAPPGPAVRH